MVFAASEETSDVGVFERAHFDVFSATSLDAHKLSFAYLRVLCVPSCPL